MNVIPQRVKDGFVRLMGPLARGLIAGGVNPNTITTIGTLIVIGSGVAFGTGVVRLGGALLLFSGLFDILTAGGGRAGKMTTFAPSRFDAGPDR
jgi:hypothetical protein